MGEAYTPGLKIKEQILIKKTRKLPIAGAVLIERGSRVTADTKVAKAMIPGEIHSVAVYTTLGIDPSEIKECMLKKLGDNVEKGEMIARYRAFFGLINKECRSPTNGSIELVSDSTGRVIIRDPPVSLEIKAYIPGEVVEILPNEGVEIETPAALIQGIFGFGGENHGELTMVAKSPEDILDETQIGPNHKEKILVGGSQITSNALKKAVEVKAKGVVVGGIRSKDLTEFLGRPIGVAITGQENIGITFIATEGFGKMRMAEKTFQLLKSHEGYQASINGATQIRAGVIRPEIIIPLESVASSEVESEEEEDSRGLEPGAIIRVIREPYLGAIGKVVRLIVELQKIESESHVRILVVELEDGRRVTIPRANVELVIG